MLKIWTKNIGKNVSKNLNGKYSYKPLNHAKQSATDAAKTSSKRAIQKTINRTGDFIGNKIADSKTFQHNKLDPVTNEHDKEIPKERSIFLEEGHKFIDDLRLI